MVDEAFLKWWAATHDISYMKDSGMYEKHAYKCFCAGYTAAAEVTKETE